MNAALNLLKTQDEGRWFSPDRLPNEVMTVKRAYGEEAKPSTDEDLTEPSGAKHRGLSSPTLLLPGAPKGAMPLEVISLGSSFASVDGCLASRLGGCLASRLASRLAFSLVAVSFPFVSPSVFGGCLASRLASRLAFLRFPSSDLRRLESVWHRWWFLGCLNQGCLEGCLEARLALRLDLGRTFKALGLIWGLLDTSL